MPWDSFKLNDDTAQLYRNETEAGIAICDSGLAYEDISITTKYSGSDNLDIQTSIRNSLKYLGVSYVDLYSSTRPAWPFRTSRWKEMWNIQAQGLAKSAVPSSLALHCLTNTRRSIDVSNFAVNDLAILLASAKVKPAHAYSASLAPGSTDTNKQDLLHPYVYARQLPSSRTPPAPDRDRGVQRLIRTGRRNCGKARCHAGLGLSRVDEGEGCRRRHARLEGYINAGDLMLTDTDIAAIDAVGLSWYHVGVLNAVAGALTGVQTLRRSLEHHIKQYVRAANKPVLKTSPSRNQTSARPRVRTTHTDIHASRLQAYAEAAGRRNDRAAGGEFAATGRGRRAGAALLAVDLPNLCAAKKQSDVSSVEPGPMSTTRSLWLISLLAFAVNSRAGGKGKSVLDDVRRRKRAGLLDVPFRGAVERERADVSLEDRPRGDRRDAPLRATGDDGDPGALEVGVAQDRLPRGERRRRDEPNIARVQATRSEEDEDIWLRFEEERTRDQNDGGRTGMGRAGFILLGVHGIEATGTG
ncbi:hypothetical protein B0H10DRAFT_1947795 [Mycena sp. CBHHK59/15]|nr:hypothetical protein B0H10DRAFT_1947795 [Mycena sp. CBHHK59/15]